MVEANSREDLESRPWILLLNLNQMKGNKDKVSNTAAALTELELEADEHEAAQTPSFQSPQPGSRSRRNRSTVNYNVTKMAELNSGGTTAGVVRRNWSKEITTPLPGNAISPAAPIIQKRSHTHPDRKRQC